MIKNPNVAKEVIEILEGTCRRLDEATALVRANCPQQEYAAFLGERAHISGQIFVKLLDPLYAAHPNLVPDEAPEDLKQRWGVKRSPV